MKPNFLKDAEEIFKNVTWAAPLPHDLADMLEAYYNRGYSAGCMDSANDQVKRILKRLEK